MDMHLGKSIRWIGAVLFGVVVIVGFWFSQGRNEGELAEELKPETEEHREVRKAVLHNVSRELVEEVLRIEAEERRVAETVWAKEMLAQECGRTIERLWDEINLATNKLEVLSKFTVGEVVFGKWDSVEELPHGIRVMKSSVTGTTALHAADWKKWLEKKIQEGWILDQIEFRQNRFEVREEGGRSVPARSVFYFAANLLKTGGAENEERVSLEGDLAVEWGAKGEDGFWEVQKVDARGLVLKRRVGVPVFELVHDEVIVPEGQARLIDPLIVYDLDGDGLSEVILAAKNAVYSPRRTQREREGSREAVGTLGKKRVDDDSITPEGSRVVRTVKHLSALHSGSPAREVEPIAFERRSLLEKGEEFMKSAVVADFDGDELADFLFAKAEGVFLARGMGGGKFAGPRLAWEGKVADAMVMTCGDVEGDGDLDVYLGQYKDPYEGGVTPRPFHDANDGYPSYLLINDGNGRFRDGTVPAGLEKKRNRRTFSASLMDLDRDEDLDLMVVSDFAGLDFYTNDGKGRFSDVTMIWVARNAERTGFGMADTFADFNRDGLLDVLMVGMPSPTLDRLNSLGLQRARDPKEREMELAMTFGNRLLFGKREGGFEMREMSHSIARAGWAWGCASLDFDNDGWDDVYVANGFQSRKTVRDSEGDYWLHDRFLESEMEAQATDLYFRSSGARNRGDVRSFGGNERNRLYWNLGGTNFLEVGYLMGVSVAEDSRNVVTGDLDGDGRMDLVMTTKEVWPEARQTLKVFRNGLAGGKEQRTKVEGRSKNVTGAGFRSQGPGR